jgi:hypothetical protein
MLHNLTPEQLAVLEAALAAKDGDDGGKKSAGFTFEGVTYKTMKEFATNNATGFLSLAAASVADPGSAPIHPFDAAGQPLPDGTGEGTAAASRGSYMAYWPRYARIARDRALAEQAAAEAAATLAAAQAAVGVPAAPPVPPTA